MKNINIFSPNCVGGFIYQELGMEFQVPFIWHIVREQDYKIFFENLPNLDFGKLNSICLTSECQKTFCGEMVKEKNPFVCLNVSSKQIPLYFIHHQYQNRQNAICTDNERCICSKDIQNYVLDKYLDRKNRFNIENTNIIVLSHAISGITLSNNTLEWYKHLKIPCKKILVVHDSEYSRISSMFSKSDVVVLRSHSKFISDAAKYVANYLKLQENQNEFDVIVSVTTYKERILSRNLTKVLDSIIFQKTKLKIKIVVTVYKDDFQYFNNEQLQYFKNYNIEVIQAPENLRPHLKYYYCAKKYQGIPIITIDDDAIYNEMLVENLYQSYETNPECVSTCGCRQIQINDRHIGKYSSYKIVHTAGISHLFLALGVCGVLYPPSVSSIMNSIDIAELKTCLTADDIFLKWLELKNNISIKNIAFKNSCSAIMKDATNTKALHLHENVTNNDILIQKFLAPCLDKLTDRLDSIPVLCL